MTIREEVSVHGTRCYVGKLATGQVTTDSNTLTSQPLDVSTAPYARIVILADTSNSTTVYVGGSTGVGSNNGIPIAAGAWVPIDSGDPTLKVRPKDIYVTGAGTSGLIVHWWGIG